ncbi:MAG TPA: DEAD/DEAH box helicase [Polyangiales bacterium]|nr:DEAD/DEAH box helicase [Polyangiales bacterium]
MKADELLERVRAECAPPVWSRALTQARAGQLTGKRASDGSLELRMSTKGGMISPAVTLDLEHGEWSCDCPSTEPACMHVAAAVLALAQAEKEGRPLDGVQGPLPTVAYELAELDGSLVLKRWLIKEGSRDLLTARLIEERQKGERAQITTTRADVEIELLLGSLRDGPIPRAFVLKLFEWLRQVDEVTFAGAPAKLGQPVHAVTARVDKRGEGFRLSVGPNTALERIYKNGVAYFKGEICPLRDVELSDTDLAALRAGKNFEPQELADLVGRVLPALRARLPVQAPRELLEGAVAMKPRVVLQTDVSSGVLEVLPIIVYGNPPSARVDEGRLTYLGGPVPLRDSDAEIALTRTVHTRLGLELGRRKRLEGEAALKLGERVRALDAIAVSGSGLESFSMRGALAPALRIEGDGFDLSFETTKGERVSGDAVVAAWRHGSPLVALEGGGFAPLPTNFLAQHGHLVTALLNAKQEKELPKASLIDLGKLCEALDQPPPPDVEALRALGRDFTGIPDAPLPAGLNAELRDYQRAGYRWLRFLSNNDLGGLLADDMGLGKTLQTLCVLEAPALVVCPASVLFNWAAELQKFRPDLRVNSYHGTNRKLDPKADVTITTYGTMRVDIAALSGLKWDSVVLDEAQSIKNPDSQVARAAYQLPARFRLALTGTPVENRLTDLWSLFHFTNRGFLGGLAEFEQQVQRPISEGDRDAAARLRTRIKPFVLRRMKREVAKELPPRTDVVLRCTLDADERAAYESIRAATQEEIVQQLSAGGNVLAALEALLRLRQACCHRALLPGLKATKSSKLELLMDTLEEALSEGHKALVFSQWTSLLDLVEPLLKERAIRFERLDGSTTDRGGVVKRFQDDANVSVMLLSLKAGGTGLNLTAADHVFLLDPWWNPAAEDQAADRAHRIGQDRPVLVHRLIATDSVEERILALQERKRTLASVATDGGEAALGITRDDLLALLA